MENELHYFAGSDNNTAYGWKIPSLEELQQSQTIYWKSSSPQTQSNIPEITVLSNQTSLVPDAYRLIDPLHINKPVFTLRNHRSIVNSVVCHPTLPIIVTAGVQKTVSIWSPHSTPPSPLSQSQIEEWKYRRDPRLCEDDMTIRMFRRMIEREQRQMETNPYVFWSREAKRVEAFLNVSYDDSSEEDGDDSSDEDEDDDSMDSGPYYNNGGGTSGFDEIPSDDESLHSYI